MDNVKVLEALLMLLSELSEQFEYDAPGFMDEGLESQYKTIAGLLSEACVPLSKAFNIAIQYAE